MKFSARRMATANAIESANRDMLSAEAALAEARRTHAAAIKEIRATCEHRPEYYSDPSGNNDSGYACIICGAELPRPRRSDR